MDSKEYKRNYKTRTVITIIGIVLNLILSIVCQMFNLPFSISMVGTVGVAIICGRLPGLITAAVPFVILNIMHTIMSGVESADFVNPVYMMLPSIVVVLFINYFVFLGKYKEKKNIISLVFILTLICGVLNYILPILSQSVLQKNDDTILDILREYESKLYFSEFCLEMLYTFIDITVSFIAAFIIIHFIPKRVIDSVRRSKWNQKPLTLEKIKKFLSKKNRQSHSLQNRITALLIFAILLTSLIITIISVKKSVGIVSENNADIALMADGYTNTILSPELASKIIETGSDTELYKETKQQLRNYMNNSGITRTYVLYEESDGLHIMFDIAQKGVSEQRFGESLYMDEANESIVNFLEMVDGDANYFFNTKKDKVVGYGRRVTDEAGNVICYTTSVVYSPRVPADIYTYIIRVVIEFSSFFIIILSFGFWITNYYIIYPIVSMSNSTEKFTKDIDDLAQTEENANKLRDLGIRTDDEIETLYNAVCEMADGVAGRMNDMQSLFEETVTALVNAIDAKDEYTHGHSSRVAEYSRRIAEAAGKDEKECNDIYFSALVHDVGKIGVPGNIINKNGRLTDEEYAIIKTHPTIGKQILEGISEYPYLSVAANYHHERYDGKGYPEGLIGEDIPEIARIVAVADAYDAMTSKRSYRDAIPQQTVREEIIKGMGTQFDPKFAKIMQHMIDVDVEYDMREKGEGADINKKNELICNKYKTSVSEGIHVTEYPITIRLKCTADEDVDIEQVIPSLIVYDALDGKYHTDEREVKDFAYFEYGAVRFDGRTVKRGVRKIETKVTDNEVTGTLSKARAYEAKVVRFKDHMKFDIYDGRRRSEITFALPDSTRFSYVAITGYRCRITDISVTKAEEKINENYIPRIAEEISYIKDKPEGVVPNVQVDGYRTDQTLGIPVKDGMKIRFHSMSLPTARLVWHCPFVVLFNSDNGRIDGNNYREFSLVRIDGEYWETDKSSKSENLVNRNESFEGWDEWKKKNKEGIDCVVTVHREGNTIIIVTENLGIFIKNITILEADIKDIYIALTGDQVAITDIQLLG